MVFSTRKNTVPVLVHTGIAARENQMYAVHEQYLLREMNLFPQSSILQQYLNHV